jgi:ABC-type bacteriocin/lantibiotic exporter with double-glycine peptidase domain
MVLAYHGVEKSEEELADLLETDFTGTAAARVHRLARYGFLTVLYEATWEDLQRYLEMRLPCIALVYTTLPLLPRPSGGPPCRRGGRPG